MLEPNPAVIKAAAAGDRGAFEQLVRGHQQPVWRFLRRLLGNDSLAEDVTQETFLRLFRRLDSFSFQSKFSSWLLRIAHNAAIDEIRRQQRQARLVEEAAVATIGHVPPTAPARVELQAALDSLPLRLREVILLVEVLGLRYREVAVVLGIPEGTVKSRVFKARMHLRDWMSAGVDAAGSEVSREL